MEIHYCHAKITNSSHFFSGSFVKFFVGLVPKVLPDHIRPPVQEPERHAIVNAARSGLPWKRAESNGHVIGFVISCLLLMLQVAHYQQLGGEGS